MTNSADQDQLASSTDLDLHCLLRQGMSCSAREGLKGSRSGTWKRSAGNLFQKIIDIGINRHL